MDFFEEKRTNFKAPWYKVFNGAVGYNFHGSYKVLLYTSTTAPKRYRVAASLPLPPFSPFFLVNKVIINMENEGVDDVYQFTPSQSSQGERKYKKKPIGMTQMNELIIKRSDNKKEVVTYNEWGQLTGDEEHPPASYAPWIESKVWDEFVKKRLSAEWEEARKVQQRRAMQNKYPQRMSRLGYAELEAKIKKDEGRCGINRAEL
ncbi:hypothetical protein PanWU01x14_113500 [Parasponia andersonii]|uniref:Uncharacterized protein n=1 Tax=Parasponia andersonii TaxID=3476 RepID=A0A2P5CXV7_PARAD|nr:hypothetical protein PanWU01x14_113500 [Parasponia andersonii]